MISGIESLSGETAAIESLSKQPGPISRSSGPISSGKPQRPAPETIIRAWLKDLRPYAPILHVQHPLDFVESQIPALVRKLEGR